MKKDDSVFKLDFSDEFMLDSVEKRAQNGDFMGALTMLNKRNQMYAPSADAQALAADIYEELGMNRMAADSWFRFLDTCNEADFAEGYEGLAVAFMNMGNEFHSALYFNRYCEEGELLSEEADSDDLEKLFAEEISSTPHLRLVHSDGESPEAFSEGLSLLKSGDLEEAKEKFESVSERSDEYATAMGLNAMCTLMLGKEDEAATICRKALKDYPENITVLTSYCAVLGAQEKKGEAKEVARRLAVLDSDNTDDLYRIATALCETNLDKEAYAVLTKLRGKLPYDDNVLYFYAVAAYRLDKLDNAIEALERLTTLYPRKAVAAYFLLLMRALRDGDGEPFPMEYLYRVPTEEYNSIAGLLLRAEKADGIGKLHEIARMPELKDCLSIAFDEMDGRDQKLQLLAAKVAVKLRRDEEVRAMLLNFEADDVVKLHALHELIMRNEEDSFGTVICNLYKEFFTHKIEIGEKKAEEFLHAFAEVYSKFALFGEDNEHKLCAAAEDVYAAIEEYGAWEYCEERASLAAAIYREARLKRGEHKLSDIVKMFNANKYKTQKILDLMM